MLLQNCVWKCSSWLGFCKTGCRYTFNFTDLALNDLFANGVCKLSLLTRSTLHIIVFSNLIDQLGVANVAYTLGSADLVYNLKHRFAYVFMLFAKSVLQRWFAN